MCAAAFVVGAAADDASSASRAERPPARAGQPALRIAITVDDLPGPIALEQGRNAPALLEAMVNTLARHGVRHATGFLIAGRLAENESGRSALDRWQEAGFALGNHGYAHLALHEVGVSDFLADLLQAHAVLRSVQASEGMPARHFRYPYLQEGRSPEERRVLARALDALGYQRAPVTIDFFDWSYADAYTRCALRGDATQTDAIARAYMRAAEEALGWSTRAAESLLQRPLPQVLLLHVNRVTADHLDALLTSYERAGARWISLDEALADRAYGEHAAAGGNWLATAARTLGRPIAASALQPFAPALEPCP